MTDVVDQMTGIIPTVVTAGVVMKITDHYFGNPLGTGKTIKKKKKSLTSSKQFFKNPLY